MKALKPIYVCQLFTDFRLVSKTTEFEPSHSYIEVIIPRFLCSVLFTSGTERTRTVWWKVFSSQALLYFSLWPQVSKKFCWSLSQFIRGNQRQFSENICSEDDLTRIFETFVVKFLACLPLLGFSNTDLTTWYNCPFLTDFYPKKVT